MADTERSTCETVRRTSAAGMSRRTLLGLGVFGALGVGLGALGTGLGATQFSSAGYVDQGLGVFEASTRGPLAPGVVSLGLGATVLGVVAGEVWVWGDKHSGMGGNGYSIKNEGPKPVEGLSGIIKVAGGSDLYTTPSLTAAALMALNGDGEVFVWGDNTRGGLANGSSTGHVDRPQRLNLPGGEKIVDIGAVRHARYALTASGRLYAWGEQVFGHAGTGGSFSRPLVAPVVVLEDVHSFYAYHWGVFAITRGDGIKVWGRVHRGNGGNGYVGNDEVYSHSNASLLNQYLKGNDGPATMAHDPKDPCSIASLHLGGSSFMLLKDGRLFSFGQGRYDDGSLLGRPSDIMGSVLPVRFPEGTKIVSVVSGDCQALALTDQGKVFAWGQDQSRFIVSGGAAIPKAPWPTPGAWGHVYAPMELPLENVKSIATTHWTSFATLADGRVIGWGDNRAGQVWGNTAQAAKFTEIQFPNAS